MELEVCAEIRWRKLPCRSTNVAELQSNWKLFLFVSFSLLYPAECIWETLPVCLSLFRRHALFVIVWSSVLLWCYSIIGKIKSIYLLITAIPMSYFLYFHIYLYFLISLSLFSVFTAQMSTMNMDTAANHMNPMVSCQTLLLLDTSCVNYRNIAV